jgi:hypothetical protein
MAEIIVGGTQNPSLLAGAVFFLFSPSSRYWFRVHLPLPCPGSRLQLLLW